MNFDIEVLRRPRRMHVIDLALSLSVEFQTELSSKVFRRAFLPEEKRGFDWGSQPGRPLSMIFVRWAPALWREAEEGKMRYDPNAMAYARELCCHPGQINNRGMRHTKIPRFSPPLATVWNLAETHSGWSRQSEYFSGKEGGRTAMRFFILKAETETERDDVGGGGDGSRKGPSGWRLSAEVMWPRSAKKQQQPHFPVRGMPSISVLAWFWVLCLNVRCAKPGRVIRRVSLVTASQRVAVTDTEVYQDETAGKDGDAGTNTRPERTSEPVPLGGGKKGFKLQAQRFCPFPGRRLTIPCQKGMLGDSTAWTWTCRRRLQRCCRRPFSMPSVHVLEDDGWRLLRFLYGGVGVTSFSCLLHSLPTSCTMVASLLRDAHPHGCDKLLRSYAFLDPSSGSQRVHPWEFFLSTFWLWLFLWEFHLAGCPIPFVCKQCACSKNICVVCRVRGTEL